MAKAVAAGWPKAMIEEAAAAKQARVDRGEDVIVGVNKYQPANDDEIEILAVDNHAVREGQVARLKRIRETRGARRGGVPQAALGRAARGRANGRRGNLSPSPVEPPARRATLGEISSAMEDGFGRYGTQPTPVKGIYAGAFDADPRWARLTDGVAATERRLGRKPRMLVAKMGQDGHDRGANLVSGMFGDLGFEIVAGAAVPDAGRSRRSWRSRGTSTSSARRAWRPAT